MKKKVIAIVVIGLFFLTCMVWLHWHGVQDGQSTLHTYPITLYPNGSGTSSIAEFIDKTSIGNATHLTNADFTAYPAIAEVLTGERSVFRGFSKMGGVGPNEEYVFIKKYYVSEYEGNYYILLVQLH
jgi:hypothetical protein